MYLSVKLVVYSSLYIDISITLVVRSIDVTVIRCCFGENLQLVMVLVLSSQKNTEDKCFKRTNFMIIFFCSTLAVG